jgi:hypothetical protein
MSPDGTGCVGKRQHVSFSAADRALKRRNDMHGSFQIYFCNRCQYWHIGNGSKARNKGPVRGSGLYRTRREKGYE